MFLQVISLNHYHIFNSFYQFVCAAYAFKPEISHILLPFFHNICKSFYLGKEALRIYLIVYNGGNKSVSSIESEIYNVPMHHFL